MSQVHSEIPGRIHRRHRENGADGAVSGAWIVLPPQLNSTITMVEYDPTWPRQFQREAERIRREFAAQRVLLEHIGSTSVPELCAKPIVDMVLVVHDSADESAYVPVLENAGYQLVIREPERDQHRMLRRHDAAVNMHVFSRHSPEIDYYLTFRNWLRANRSDRELYARTKRRLAARTWRYTHDYTAAKSEVVRDIMARARRWR